MASPKSKDTAGLAETLSSGTLVPTAAEGKAGGSFPPFDPANFAPQLVWLALTFGVLYWLLSRKALPKIGEVLAERKDRIERDLTEAQRLKAETDAALAAYEKSLADARARAQSLAKDTRDKVTADLERDRARADQDNAAKVADMERRIEESKSRALATVGDIATDTATAIIGRLLGREVPANDVRRAVDASKQG